MLFEFQISIAFVIGAYFILHSTFIFSIPSATIVTPSAATAGTNAPLKSTDRGELELPEEQSLLADEVHPSVDILSPHRSRVVGPRTTSMPEGGTLAKGGAEFSNERGFDTV